MFEDYFSITEKMKSKTALSGLLYDNEGNERPPFPIGGFYIRRSRAVRITETEIIWGTMPRTVPFPQDLLPVPYDLRTFTLLQDFVALAADSTPDALCEFAKRYGPLRGLKVHGGERESLKNWRYCIEFAKGVLEIARKLQDGQLAPDGEWRALGAEMGAGPESMPRALKRTVQWMIQRAALTSSMNQILWLWGVRPSICWISDSEVSLQLGGHTLLSGIGAQLLSAICRSDSFILCAACGRPYPPKRKPRKGEKHFCQECGKKAAVRLNQRKRRQSRARSRRKGTVK
jgi:hypothetical protein